MNIFSSSASHFASYDLLRRRSCQHPKAEMKDHVFVECVWMDEGSSISNRLLIIFADVSVYLHKAHSLFRDHDHVEDVGKPRAATRTTPLSTRTTGNKKIISGIKLIKINRWRVSGWA